MKTLLVKGFNIAAKAIRSSFGTKAAVPQVTLKGAREVADISTQLATPSANVSPKITAKDVWDKMLAKYGELPEETRKGLEKMSHRDLKVLHRNLVKEPDFDCSI